jgi:pimeloyl-ACP methyl ester carboxylesterase/acyl carrier protein
VRLRPDGLLERLGRKDRQVKIRGQRVELEAVEASLRQHSLVRDVGVVARASWTDGNPTLVAYIRAERSSSVLLDELKTIMRAAPPVMRPVRFYLIDELPRLPSSKLDVQALIALDETNAAREHNSVAAATIPSWISRDDSARTVAEAWQRVLWAPVTSPDDDFFELGGDSLRAIALLSDLERALGTELPLSLISEAPRFAQLCAALKQLAEHRTALYAPLVLLKAGDDSPPVYLVHGAGGNVVELFPLARSMTYPGPVFGIQARGLVRGDSPHTSVEAMAVEYLREIKARQPKGPYHLGGYSLGGLVAFEMARRLRDAGDEVGLVGLFDTLPAALRWPLNLWPAWIRRRIGRLARAVAPTRVLKVAASALLASARYRPGFYPGEIHLFVPSERDPALPSPQAFWHRHARTVLTINTPGRHLTMLVGPHAESTAATLTSCLPVRCGTVI